MQPFKGPIVDFGCGTGTLLRLIAREHRDLELVGIDCAENLIEIARSLSSDFENASFLSGDFTEVVEEPQFGTIISVCGLEFPDQPDVTPTEEEAVTRGGPPDRVRLYIHAMTAKALTNWRRQTREGGTLLVFARLQAVCTIAAFILEAAASGFIINYEQSERLSSGSERFPALNFSAGRPSEVDLSPLASWL
jgi:SAM-dependent methyltransferase